jgi:Spy/CpxP family protein refolding chaperone
MPPKSLSMPIVPPQQRFAGLVPPVLSGLVVSVCLALPTVALAQPLPQSMPLSQPIPATPSLAANPLSDLEAQPAAAQDLVIENLSADQIAQLEGIFSSYQPQIEAAASDYSEALAVLNNLLVPTTGDTAIASARDNAVNAERVLDDLVFERNLAIRSVLTPAQRQGINAYLRAWLEIGPANPAMVFPENLVGLETATATAQLQADGWQIVLEAPGLLGFDRDNQELDLDVGRNGKIEAARLTE